MNIEQVRAFLHAQDTTDLWDMLRWINDQTCLADHGGDVDPAYDYLLGPARGSTSYLPPTRPYPMLA